MSVSIAVHECVQLLISAQTDKTQNPDLRFELANLLVRLKIWAGNVGVFAPDNASTDYRLRDDPDLVEIVCSMTKTLQQSLRDAIHPPLLEESDNEDNKVGQDRGGVSTCSDSSSASLDLDSSVEESDSGNNLQRLGPSAIFVEEANNVINRLYRLVTVFRKPASSSENVKIRDFTRKLVEKGEVDDLEDVRDHISSHIKARFPEAPAFLESRLIEAVVFRRMRIRYRQHHQAKLEQGLAPAFAFPAQNDEEMKTPHPVPEMSGHLSVNPGGDRDMSRNQPTLRRIAFSATNASSINRAKMTEYARSTALSGITEAAVGRRQRLDVPPPPINDRQNKVECPYCLRIISKDEMIQPRWTRHILKDIDPLVCLFKDCEENTRLFNTVEEWLGHMRWEHTIVYSCHAVGHEQELFNSPQDLEDHIRGQHPDTFTESQLPGLVSQGTLPAPNTLGALNASLDLGESCCVLCNNSYPQTREADTTQDEELGGDTEQTLQSHIIGHLEVVALIALPPSDDADGVDSNESHRNDSNSGLTRTTSASQPLSVKATFQPFIDFHKWVTDNQENGTDGLGNDARYIPFGVLEKYWQHYRVSSILQSCSRDTPISVSIDDLLKTHLRIFSILVYISTTETAKVDYIEGFIEKATDDRLLPFKSKPEALFNAADGVQTFDLFQEYQWLFSPVILGPDRLHSMELPLQSALPFTVEKLLSGKTGESKMVKKCKVHPSCGLSITTIVLKEFDSSEIEYSFRNEVTSYLSLENNVPPGVYEQQFLKYYGSFKNGEKAFIMLEYADQGSLLDFFSRNELPRERHELYGLWWSLRNLLFGLERIHGLEQDPRNSGYGTIHCVHQDLKPGNIFVFRQGDSTAYNYQFKIGDFEMSSVALVKTMNKSVRSPAEPSTKMYGAPELTYRHADLEDIDYGALWEMDIWSFGCVLFECLVWMTCGSKGLSEFARMRQNETDGDQRHKSHGYSGCFHNGSSRVQAVDDMMRLVMERRRSFDDLSGPIGDLIINNMLIPSSRRRYDARTLLARFEKILEAEPRPTEHFDTSNEPSLTGSTQGRRLSQEDRGDKAVQVNDLARYLTGQGSQSYTLQNLRSTESFVKPYAVVKIPEVLLWIEKKKKGRPFAALPDHDRAMQQINGRHQIFVVDDSSTMRRHHWNHVIDTVRALGYLVKHADPDGVELFITSGTTKPKKSRPKEISTVVRALEEHERIPPGGPCNMESSLGPVLEHVKSNLTKGPRFFQQANRRGINVYILTDAIWEGGTEVQCGVEMPIADLSRTMKALGKGRTTVALQFIQFGDDALGEERLRYLDEELGKQLDFDIVDHRHHQRDGVWHMLVGPISHNIDGV